MENTTSPQSSCISQPAAAVASISAGESSWAMHFANFVASTDNRQEMDHQGEASDSDFSSGFSSSFDSLGDGSDTDSFLTSDLMDEDDEDDSLQDTACSSAARPKVTSMHDMFIKSILTMDAKDMNTAQLAKYFLDAGSRQQATGAAPEVISGGNSNEKQLHEFNDLRKKGLCLVPLSMLIDYLG
ncbi:vascular-related unknown protein 4-like [Triticum dicoccoides]|uniref:vascular-related unknown protein 4-like n=1 Tax=Triticum dicoccoides TaxID=85692 RepID=UPI00188E9B3E|nr:vascular-related unknown protein 4-like [Triticum dicoccoides]